MKNQRSKKAFTLIELLVVISIIALLLSILLPSLNRAREYSKGVVCSSNLRQMGISLSMYVTEYSCMPVIVQRHWHDPLIPGLAEMGKGYNWAGLIRQAQDIELTAFRCPSDRRDYEMSELKFQVPEGYDRFSEHLLMDYGAVFCGYMIPGRKVCWSIPELPYDSTYFPKEIQGRFKLSKLRRAEEMMLIWDSHAIWWSDASGYERAMDWLESDLKGDNGADMVKHWQGTVFRHSRGTGSELMENGPNCLFADMHVEQTIDLTKTSENNANVPD